LLRKLNIRYCKCLSSGKKPDSYVKPTPNGKPLQWLAFFMLFNNYIYRLMNGKEEFF